MLAVHGGVGVEQVGEDGHGGESGGEGAHGGSGEDGGGHDVLASLAAGR